MHGSSSPIKDCSVYKRRKMQRNIIAFLSGQNASEVTDKNNIPDFNLSPSEYQLIMHDDSSDDVQIAIRDHSRDREDDEKPSFSGRNHLDVCTTYKSQQFGHKNVDYEPICAELVQSFDTEVSHFAKDFTNELSSTRNCNETNGTTATSKSYLPSFSDLSTTAEHSVECSNSSSISLKSFEMFDSPEELCIYVLKSHRLIGKESRNSCRLSPKKPVSAGPVYTPCKICGLPENVRKMLICDDCEEAFHLSCCRPKIKKLPVNEWYCQLCLTKKQKHLLMKDMGTSSITSDDTSESGGPISSMLRGIHTHKSRVRMGDDFQVEVPDWSSPISNDDNYFGEPKEIDQVDCCRHEGWSWQNTSKFSSIGNWLQCNDEDDNGNICGKWRRAPLFSVQTDDWDCSCALPWDPIHADCSVPQELDTMEVLKHLKHVEMFKSRLNNRMKSA